MTLRLLCLSIFLSNIPLTAEPQQLSPAGQKWSLRKLPLQTSGESLQIHLRNVGPLSRWVIGIKVAPVAPYFVAGNGSLIRDAQGGNRVSEFADHDPSALSTEEGKLTFDLGSQPSRGFLLYVAIPSARKVFVFADGVPLPGNLVSDSLFIKNGELLNEPLPDFHRALMRLFLPESSPPLPIVRTNRGEFFASKEHFYQHLKGINAIHSIPLPINKPHASVVVEVSVDGAASVVSSAGDSQVATLASSAIKSWKFEPFVFEGKTVPARTVVLVGLDESGALGIVR